MTSSNWYIFIFHYLKTIYQLYFLQNRVLFVSFLASEDVPRNGETGIKTSAGVSCNENKEENSTKMHNISGCVNEDSFI